MRFALLIPGTGGTRCAACARHRDLAHALRQRGHHTTIVPLYLPHLGTGSRAAPCDAPLFFGGIRSYLQQIAPPFRYTPEWVDRLFDHPALLAAAARRASSTSGPTLGPMTISMLQGERGRHAKELRRLCAWLRDCARPDAAVLSNALLAGLANAVRRTTGATVLGFFEGEAPFIDDLGPWSAPAWDALRLCAPDTDAWLGPEPLARPMAQRLGLHLAHLRFTPDNPDPDVLAAIVEAAANQGPAAP